jgi:hypothetical protein
VLRNTKKYGEEKKGKQVAKPVGSTRKKEIKATTGFTE